MCDTYLIQRKRFCYSKCPTRLKSSSNHRTGCGWGSRCNSKWVDKLHSTHFNTNIYIINRSEEFWKLGLIWDLYPNQALKIWNQIYLLWSYLVKQQLNSWSSLSWEASCHSESQESLKFLRDRDVHFHVQKHQQETPVWHSVQSNKN